MTKIKDTDDVTIERNYPLFSSVSDLLKYRDQMVKDANHHSSEMVSAVRYYTTLISALFSIQISIMIASFNLLYDKFFANNPFSYLIFIFIPIIIIGICNAALKNSKRLYERTMEYVSIKLKIDEMLGIHNQKLYSKLREKNQLILFGKDDTFANSRWEEENRDWVDISSKEFVNKLVKKKTTGYFLFSRVFITFKYIAYAFFIITFILTVLPLINHLLC